MMNLSPLLRWILKKLIGMIKAGKIIDSKTICAVMIYAAKKEITYDYL